MQIKTTERKNIHKNQVVRCICPDILVRKQLIPKVSFLPVSLVTVQDSVTGEGKKRTAEVCLTFTQTT